MRKLVGWVDRGGKLTWNVSGTILLSSGVISRGGNNLGTSIRPPQLPGCSCLTPLSPWLHPQGGRWRKSFLPKVSPRQVFVPSHEGQNQVPTHHHYAKVSQSSPSLSPSSHWQLTPSKPFYSLKSSIIINSIWLNLVPIPFSLKCIFKKLKDLRGGKEPHEKLCTTRDYYYYYHHHDDHYITVECGQLC